MRRERFVSPQGIETYQEDGRLPIEEVYRRLQLLEDYGWRKETVHQQEGVIAGKEVFLPIYCLTKGKKGRADWFVFAIHGDEIGPWMATLEIINFLIRQGREKPIVLLGPCNPWGLVSNNRLGPKGVSVGDCLHYFRQGEQPTCPEAGALASFSAILAEDYPPRYVYDGHEDGKARSKEGGSGSYFYLHGSNSGDSLAGLLFTTLSQQEIPVILSGQTGFGEEIKNGTVFYSKQTEGGMINPGDESFDQFLAVETGATVFVPETPINYPLAQRMVVHKEMMKLILGYE